MIINNSKKALAAKIRNSGFAWPDSGKWAIQDKDGEVFVCSGISVPVRRTGEVNWEFGEPYMSAGILSLGSNWFQCILSRAEYFHLYPAPDADGWIEWEGGECPVESGVLIDVKYRDGAAQKQMAAREPVADSYGVTEPYWRCDMAGGDIIAYRLHKPERASETGALSADAASSAKDALMSDSIEGSVRKQTIEQLAADYRNAKDCADRKQQEADAAKADSDEKLRVLELAGEAHGLLVTPITSKQEPELVITDFRDLRVGDEISVQHMKNVYSKSEVLVVGNSEVAVRNHAGARKTVNLDAVDWKFIRRP